jgi:TPR repeat protein
VTTTSMMVLPGQCSEAVRRGSLQSGTCPAQFNLGHFYWKGVYAAQDTKQAVSLFRPVGQTRMQWIHVAQFYLNGKSWCDQTLAKAEVLLTGS